MNQEMISENDGKFKAKRGIYYTKHIGLWNFSIAHSHSK